MNTIKSILEAGGEARESGKERERERREMIGRRERMKERVVEGGNIDGGEARGGR